MSLIKLVLAGALVASAAVAHAVPTYSVSTPDGSYGLPGAYTLVGYGSGTATVTDLSHTTPVGLADGAAYLYTYREGNSVTVDVNAPSFSFLWGTPDTFNVVTYHTSLGDFVYDGTQLNGQFGLPADGSNYSTVFTASLAGGTIGSATFTASGVAFEFAVAQPVPEPETWALMAAGLAAIGFMFRRARSRK